MHTGNSKGQALAEFIIVIPLLLVVLLGTIQFSLLYFAYQMVHYASFAATRAAIVRPCAAFHPDDSAVAHFTPAVFTAATLATMVAMPPQCMVSGITRPGQVNPCVPNDLAAFPFLPQPLLPLDAEGEVLLGLDFDGRAAPGDLALTKYVNAAYLTSVQRVEHAGLGARPMVWTPNPDGAGPGIPCDAAAGHEQNVPAPGDDVTLEVTLIYPLTVPLVNRVIFGIFVNFSSTAQDRLLLPQIFGPDGGTEDVMVTPTRALAPLDRNARFNLALTRIFQEFGYSDGAWDRLGQIVTGLSDRAWYPLPVRARCTLTAEGAMYRMTGPPTSRGW